MHRLSAALVADAEDTGVIYVDLDRFKAVNDRFGHSEGDAVLQEAARRTPTWLAQRIIAESTRLRPLIRGDGQALYHPTGESLRVGTKWEHEVVSPTKCGGFHNRESACKS